MDEVHQRKDDRMRIAIVAKAKQGDILEALKKRGWSQNQGAEFVGMRASDFGRLLNLQWVPKEFSLNLTIKLQELTGKTPEELFPDWARQREFLEMPKVSQRFVEATPQLLQNFAPQHLLLGPEEAYSRNEAKQIIDEVLRTLPPTEEKVVRGLIMEEVSSNEIGEALSYTGSRIRQIANKALAKLRKPRRASILRKLY